MSWRSPSRASACCGTPWRWSEGPSFAKASEGCFGAAPKQKGSGQALHGTGRTSSPLLPSGPGGVHAPAHAWRLAKAERRWAPFPCNQNKKGATRAPGGRGNLFARRLFRRLFLLRSLPVGGALGPLGLVAGFAGLAQLAVHLLELEALFGREFLGNLALHVLHRRLGF